MNAKNLLLKSANIAIMKVSSIILTKLKSIVIQNIVKEALERICRSRMDSTFCSDYIKTFGDIILDSIVFEGVNNTVVCQKFAMCPYTFDRNALDAYVQDVLQGKPAPNVPAPTNRSTYSILHVSDIHIDFFYQEVRIYDYKKCLFLRELMQIVEASNVVERIADLQQILPMLQDIGVL